MIESDYVKELIGTMKYHGWDVQVHQDKNVNFIPDLSFGVARTDGWIEVKYQDTPPATLGSIDHYTMGQQQWLIDRGRAGSGNCFLLLGTPSMHAVWRYQSLEGVRNMPLTHARKFAWIEDHRSPSLIRRMDAVLRDRRELLQRGPV